MRLFLRGSSVVFAVVSALAFILAPAASADQLKAQTTVGSNLPVRPCLFVFSDTAAAQSTNVITMRCFFPPLCRWPVLGPVFQQSSRAHSRLPTARPCTVLSHHHQRNRRTVRPSAHHHQSMPSADVSWSGSDGTTIYDRTTVLSGR